MRQRLSNYPKRHSSESLPWTPPRKPRRCVSSMLGTTGGRRSRCDFKAKSMDMFPSRVCVYKHIMALETPLSFLQRWRLANSTSCSGMIQNGRSSKRKEIYQWNQ